MKTNEKLIVMREIIDDMEVGMPALYEITGDGDDDIWEAVKAINAAIEYLEQAIRRIQNGEQTGH